MIIDKLENLPMYFSLHPDMEKACEFLKEFYANLGKLRTVDNQPTIAETTKVIYTALGITE